MAKKALDCDRAAPIFEHTRKLARRGWGMWIVVYDGKARRFKSEGRAYRFVSLLSKAGVDHWCIYEATVRAESAS